MVDSKHDIGIK